MSNVKSAFVIYCSVNKSGNAVNNISDKEKGVTKMLDKLALILVIIGAINWGSIGLFQFDIVGWIFGGQSAVVSRIIFTVVALAGIWCISLLFRENEVLVDNKDM